MESTVVSMLPYEFRADFPGIVPPYFYIPKAEKGDFIVLHVPDCLNHVPVGEGRVLTRTILGEQIASSIAKDHISASLYVTDEAFPGIKSISGKHEKADIKKMYGEELKALEAAQRAWFRTLVNKADDAWKDPNQRGQSMAISDLQRSAAIYLGLMNKEWLNANPIDLVPCKFCTVHIPGNAIICPQCKQVVNAEAYKKMTLQEA